MSDSVEVFRMVLDGRISGRISEWPQLRAAISDAAEELTRLRALAGASELQAHATLRDLLKDKSLHVMGREHFDDERKPLYQIAFGMVIGDKVLFREANGGYIVPRGDNGAA